jgi:hypothetical protein
MHDESPPVIRQHKSLKRKQRRHSMLRMRTGLVSFRKILRIEDQRARGG